MNLGPLDYESGNDNVFSNDVDVDGNMYITGRTSSQSSIATQGAFDDSRNGGSWCPYIVKFNSSGVRQWGTYYQGGDGRSVCSDVDGNVYLAGLTNGGMAPYDSIPTNGAHQEQHGSNGDDAFLVKFDENGNRLWGTFYGGNGQDEGQACVLDSEGSVYLVGRTRSTNSISTAGAYQADFGGDFGDAFIAKFDSQGVREWGTYFGGGGYDIGLSVAVNQSALYISGKSQSSLGIATTPSYQSTLNGQTDSFLAQFEVQLPNGGAQSITGNDFSVYPNPSSGLVSVASEIGGLIELWSIDGQLLRQVTAIGKVTTIDVSGLHSGQYVIRQNHNHISSVIVQL